MKNQTIQENLIRSLITLALLSTLFCLMKTEDTFSANWILCLLPLILSLILLVPSVHFYISNTCTKIQAKSLGILLFSIYTFSLSIVTFVFLAALKNDDNISASWYAIFIPIWYAIGTYACFCVFMFPGMMDPTVNLTREAWVLLAYLIALISSAILMLIWLEDNLHHFIIACSPILAATIFALITFVVSRRKGPEKKSLFAIEFFFYMATILLCVTLSVRDETDDVLPDYMVYIVIAKFLVISLIQIEIENYKGKKELLEKGEYQEL